MIQRFFIFLTIFSALFFSAGRVMAEAITSSSQSVTVSATVLPNRLIYADSQGNLIRVASNTTDNVAPQVIVNRLPSSLTTRLNQQYLTLLSNNGGHLGIGYYSLSSYETMRLASAKAFSSSLSKLEFY